MNTIGVFLDRDGTICKDVHYMSRPELLELLPKVAEGIKLLNELGVKVIVVTNQSGITRGYFCEEDLKNIHEKMIAELSKKEAIIDDIYYCPHHPDDNCSCRKPRTGMLDRAKTDLKLDLNKCFIIGDRKLDIQAGQNAGCTTILVPGPETESNVDANYIATDFYDAAKFVSKSLQL